MALRAGLGGAPVRPRRRPIVPLPIKREVQEQPIFRPAPPPPRATPSPPSPTRDLSRREGQAYAETQSHLLNYALQRKLELQARKNETDAARQSNQSTEALVQDQQANELRALHEGMMPDEPSLPYLQAVAFRGNRPLGEMKDEARNAEGQAKLRDFTRWWDKALPEERSVLQGTALGLAKEGMSAKRYQDIVADTRTGTHIGKYDDDELEKADRVLQASIANTPGLAPEGTPTQPAARFLDSLPSISPRSEAQFASPKYRRETQERAYHSMPQAISLAQDLLARGIFDEDDLAAVKAGTPQSDVIEKIQGREELKDDPRVGHLLNVYRSDWANRQVTTWTGDPFDLVVAGLVTGLAKIPGVERLPAPVRTGIAVAAPVAASILARRPLIGVTRRLPGVLRPSARVATAALGVQPEGAARPRVPAKAAVEAVEEVAETVELPRGEGLVYSTQNPKVSAALKAGTHKKPIWTAGTIEAKPGVAAAKVQQAEGSEVFTFRPKPKAKPTSTSKVGAAMYRPKDLEIVGSVPQEQVFGAEIVARARPISAAAREAEVAVPGRAAEVASEAPPSAPLTIKAFRGTGGGNLPPGENLGQGTYYSSSRKLAKTFGPDIEEVSIRLEKPFVTDDPAQLQAIGRSTQRSAATAGRPYGTGPDDLSLAIRNGLEDQGYDGIVIRSKAGYDEFVVFDPDRSVESLRGVEAVPSRAVPEGTDLVSRRAQVDDLERRLARSKNDARRFSLSKELTKARQALALEEAKATAAPIARALESETGAVRIPGGEEVPLDQVGAADTMIAEAKARLTTKAASEAAEATPEVAAKPRRFKADDTIYDRKGQPYTFVKHGGKAAPGKVFVRKGIGKTTGRPFAIPRKGLSSTSPTAEPLPITPHKVRFREGEKTIEKLSHLIRTSKRLKPEQRSIATGIHERKLGAGVAVEAKVAQAAGRKPGDVSRAFKGQLTGKENLPTMEPQRGKFSDKEILQLEDTIGRRYPNRPHERQNARDAMDKLLDGYPLATFEQRLLTGIVPADALDLVGRAAEGLGKKVGREVGGVLNLLRAIQIVDPISHALRQGGLAVTHPIAWGKNMYHSIHTLTSARYADDWARTMAEKPNYMTIRDFGKEGGAFDGIEEQIDSMISRGLPPPKGWAPSGKARAPLEERITTGERSFVDRMLLKVPGVKQSERTFRLGIGGLRFDLQDNFYKAFKKGGQSDEAIGEMLKFFNRATGRGTLGPWNKEGPILSQIFYAIRLVASRPQAAAHLFNTKSGAVRLLAARTVLGYAGMVAGGLYLAKLAGADVEVDSRSANWGKLKVGDTRVDLTAGFGPIIRLAARVSTEIAGGKGVKTDIGDFRDTDIRDALGIFIESKLAPSVSLGVDVAKGEAFGGRKLRADWETVRTEALNRATPLFVQSIVEAIRVGGWPQAPLALGEMVGLGTMTYNPPSAAIFELLSDDIQEGLIDLDDYPELEGRVPRTRGELHPKDQQEFEKRHKDELAEIEKQYELQPEDTVSTTLEEAQAYGEGITKDVLDLEQLVKSGDMTKEGFAEGVKSLKSDSRAVSGIIGDILKASGFEEDERPDVPGVMQDIYDYGKIFDKYPNTKTDPRQKRAMFRAVDNFRERMGQKREDEMDENLNLDFKESPLYLELDAANDELNESGYFDRTQKTWDWVRGEAAAEGVTLPEDRFEYRTHVQTQYKGVEDRYYALKDDPWLALYDDESDYDLYDWKLENPHALHTAIDWGFKNGSQDDFSILEDASIDISDIEEY